MATNEDEPPPPLTMKQAVAAFYGRTVEAVTDTGPDLRLRVFILILVMIVCLSTAPYPANVIGTVAGVMLSFSAPVRRRPLK